MTDPVAQFSPVAPEPRRPGAVLAVMVILYLGAAWTAFLGVGMVVAGIADDEARPMIIIGLVTLALAGLAFWTALLLGRGDRTGLVLATIAAAVLITAFVGILMLVLLYSSEQSRAWFRPRL